MSDLRLLYSPYEATNQRTAFERAVKRAVDVVVSVTAIAFFLPLFMIAAIAIMSTAPDQSYSANEEVASTVRNLSSSNSGR